MPLGAGDLNAASIGNDPGAIISSSATPNVGYVSVDVRAAVQADVNNGRAFSAFMIRMQTDTDNDHKGDYWIFEASEMSGTAIDPFIQVEMAPAMQPVGGFIEPVNSVAIAAPYLALFGRVAAVAIVVVKPWKKRET